MKSYQQNDNAKPVPVFKALGSWDQKDRHKQEQYIQRMIDKDRKLNWG